MESNSQQWNSKYQMAFDNPNDMIRRHTLVCPDCRYKLQGTLDAIVCERCGTRYPSPEAGPADLRLQREKSVQILHRLGRGLFEHHPPPDFSPLTINPDASQLLQESDLPIHLTREQASYFASADADDARCLDLGCGDGEYRNPIELTGFHWTGIDFNHPDAPIHADAHALPFPDDTFDMIVSLAVLEHVQYPQVVLREAFRVLKPGGRIVASVAYLVPFHGASYFNMTHYGAFSAFHDAGFEVLRVAPDRDYLGVRALSFAGLFYGVPRWLCYAIVWPLILLHRLWWRLRRVRFPNQYSVQNMHLLNSGALTIVANKSIESLESD